MPKLTYIVNSEKLAPYSQPGSFLFSQPSEVDTWCQSVGFPLTPPDTASECSLSDCSDMNSMWSQASLPEETWSTVPASDHSTMVQPSGNEWHSKGHSVTPQDLHALDTATWLNVSQGPVDLGLSPALSHESQSTHTLNTISEPELPLLPPGLDLSFISEPSWDASGPVVYSGSHVPQDFSATAVTSPGDMSNGFATGYLHPEYSAPSSAVCAPQQPVYYFQGCQAPYPRRAVSDPSIAPQRPLLPRTDAQPLSVRAVGHPIAPQGHTSTACHPDSGRVSKVEGLPENHAARGPAHIQYQGPAVQSTRMIAPGHTLISPRPEAISASQPQDSIFVSDAASEEFSSFIRYDQDERSSVAALRLERMKTMVQVCSTDLHGSFTPVYGPGLGDEQDGPLRHSASSSSGSTGETDEGRYRNHPLYSEGPHSDGLYHCPFKSDPSCPHKPTKLKCNYEYDPRKVQLPLEVSHTDLFDSKFIDSHLKPFRCKIEACSKQEFSSTACLLRHEREAHGMHGHGDRPHLCYYPGCERGIVGNGFPRRYNLFDHMKRVHDHKEDPAMPTHTGPDSQGPRKAGGRKRKAPSSVSSEPPARRTKVQQPTPELEIPSHAFGPQVATYPEYNTPQVPRQDPVRQRNLYSQWNQQKELLEFQLNTVRSPEDMANLQYLSQNVEELRRLSQQARQG